MNNREIGKLINGYLDDTLTPDELERLGEWIEASPNNAEEFSRAVMLHDQLQSHFGTPSFDRHHAEAEPVKVPKSGISGRPPNVWSQPAVAISATVAAVLIVTIGLVLWKDKGGTPFANEPDRMAIATIAKVTDAKWNGELEFYEGDRILPQKLSLLSGIVRMQMDSGVEVTLQGPAEYELIASDDSKLTSGLIAVTVPDEENGFRVETPAAEIADRGTAFGIYLDDAGTSRISAFDGDLNVVRRGSRERRLLKEGESVRVSSEGEMESVDLDVASFDRVWPVSSGIEKSSGAFRLAPPGSRRKRLLQSDDLIFVVREGGRKKLSTDLAVNIASPGEYKSESDLTPSTIEAGKFVRSLLLQFQPESVDQETTHRISGEITFDKPVLGLIVLNDELNASSGHFSRSGRRGQSNHRQLNLIDKRFGDVVTLSEDRRTVHLELVAPRRTSDVVRVIVDASNTRGKKNR